MAQQNVEIARRFVARLFAWSPEEVGDHWESDADYYPVRKFPEAKPCHGREEIVRFVAEFGGAWERARIEVKDARAIGDDRVLVHARMSAAGRASGAALEGDLYHCFWLRHGRFIRAEDHLTEQGALHALGLSGETIQVPGLSE
jgi:ketosteroid isomerase-like protein